MCVLYIQLREGKPAYDATKEGPNGELTNQKSIDVPSNITKSAAPAVLTNGDAKVLENVATVKAQAVCKPVPVTAKELVSNGVANGLLA